MDLTEIKKSLTELLFEIKDDNWKRCNVLIQFPPTINKSFKVIHNFFDSNDSRLMIFLPINMENSGMLFDFIKLNYESVNQFDLNATRENIQGAAILASFNQEIVTNFENNLPKSKRGKSVPWWKNKIE
jgi:hypothetical protein